MTIDNIDEMYDALKKFKILKKELKDYCLGYLKNKNLPLEDRWNLFVENKNLFPIDNYIMHFKELDSNNIDYYDDFGYEKYQLVPLVELIESLDDGWPDVNLNNLKEEILEKGYSGFIVDW